MPEWSAKGKRFESPCPSPLLDQSSPFPPKEQEWMKEWRPQKTPTETPWRLKRFFFPSIRSRNSFGTMPGFQAMIRISGNLGRLKASQLKMHSLMDTIAPSPDPSWFPPSSWLLLWRPTFPRTKRDPRIGSPNLTRRWDVPKRKIHVAFFWIQLYVSLK